MSDNANTIDFAPDSEPASSPAGAPNQGLPCASTPHSPESQSEDKTDSEAPVEPTNNVEKMEKDNEPEQNCDSVSETKETTSSSNEPQSDATINLLPPEPQESPLEPKYTAEELLIMQLEKLEGWALKRYLRRETLLPEELDDPYHEDDDLEEYPPLSPEPTPEVLSALSTLPSVPHLTFDQRLKLIMREIEELRDSILLSHNAFEERLSNAQAERTALQQLATDLERETAEFKAKVAGDVDPISGKPREEAFRRQFESSVKSKDAALRLLSLQTASQKNQAKKLSARLSLRESTGESVRAIDFDQLRIENRIFAAKLEAMGRELLELKQAQGRGKGKKEEGETKVKAKPKKVEIEYPTIKFKPREQTNVPKVDLPGTKEFISVIKQTDKLLQRISAPK